MMVTHYSEAVLWLADKLGLRYYGNNVESIVSNCSDEQLHALASESDTPDSVMQAIALSHRAKVETLDLVFSKAHHDPITLILLAGNPNSSNDLISSLTHCSFPNARDTALRTQEVRKLCRRVS